jgi:hypothetical protein
MDNITYTEPELCGKPLLMVLAFSLLMIDSGILLVAYIAHWLSL